jgi:hypothetical protein
MMEKIEFIDNFGEITADEKQLGVISLLMRTREGELIQRGKVKQDDTVEIGNVGVFNIQTAEFSLYSRLGLEGDECGVIVIVQVILPCFWIYFFIMSIVAPPVVIRQ